MIAKRILQMTLAAGALSGICRADTVFLSDGSEINGTIVEENNTTVAVKRGNGSIQSFRRGDVESIVYDKKKGEEKAEAVKKETPVAAKPAAADPKTEVKAETPAKPEVATDPAKTISETKTPDATGEASKTEPTKTADGTKTDSTKTAVVDEKGGPEKKDETKKDETAGKTDKEAKARLVE